MVTQAGVAHRINPTMNAMQATGPDASGDRLTANADRVELGQRNHPVLPRGDLGDLGVMC
jgi:hypothetical protein